jgi:predicted patatin/cPLA2 family phospholipase
MKALIISVGGLRGAYDAGVATALLRKLGPKYFDSIYMSSVGSFTGTFFAANQADVIEETWRNRVHGKQLINYSNILKGKNILNTEYLIDLFSQGKCKLNLENLFSSGIKLNYIVENVKNESVEYLQPKQDNIFTIMRAATAVPLAHKPVKLNGETYIDGGSLDPLPIRKAIDDGYNEITIIYNKSIKFYNRKPQKYVAAFFGLFATPQMKRMLRLSRRELKIDEYIMKTHNIKVIRPEVAVPFLLFNTNKKVINRLFDLGLVDGNKAAESGL